MWCHILWTIFVCRRCWETQCKNQFRTGSSFFFLELLAKTFPLAEADHKMFKSPGMMSNLTKFLELSKETEDVITQIFLSK